MLQQLDSNQAAEENAVEEQNKILSEKDRIIQSNKAEIERLEKRTKMYEHKVHDKKKSSVNPWLVRVIFLTKRKWIFFFRLTSCRKQLKSTRMTSAYCTTSWKPESRGWSGSCLTRDAWSSACMERSQTRSSSGRKNVWVNAPPVGLS